MTLHSDIEDGVEMKDTPMYQDLDDEDIEDEISNIGDYMDDEEEDDDFEDDDDDDDDDEDENGMEDQPMVGDEGESPKTKKVIRRAYIPNLSRLNEGDNPDELECNIKAYLMYHKAETGFPCLSFDLLSDDLGSGKARAERFPQTGYAVAGTQADKVQLNKLLVLKFHQMNPVKSKTSQDSESDDDDDEDEEDLPELNCAGIPHGGAVNRVRARRIGDKQLAATFSDLGVVHIWDLQTALSVVESSQELSRFHKQQDKTPLKPIFSFTGHSDEGYGLDWSPCEEGTLATGDCKKQIFLWKLRESGWVVDQLPLSGHEDSVEDLQWSPNEPNILASCSVDRSICIWDVRSRAGPAIRVPEAHTTDVNVISWNRREKAFILSGGDDGAIKTWDLRQFRRSGSNSSVVKPVATFKHHNAPITSLEWHPSDSTVFAAASEDNQITQWDLSVEVDQPEVGVGGETPPQDEDLEVMRQLPPQLLFIHQGQKEVKELHWHPQAPGIIYSTAINGFDIFRTISV